MNDHSWVISLQIIQNEGQSKNIQLLVIYNGHVKRFDVFVIDLQDSLTFSALLNDLRKIAIFLDIVHFDFNSVHVKTLLDEPFRKLTFD